MLADLVTGFPDSGDAADWDNPAQAVDDLPSDLEGPIVLLVASGGGHLKELHSLAKRLPGFRGYRRVWVTYDTNQARTLLDGERVVWAHHPTTRNVPNLLRNARLAHRLFKELDVRAAISTGAAVAVPFLTIAERRGASVHYIESGTRVAGPSLSGRMLESLRGINLYTQYPEWKNPRWRFGGSVFDCFTAEQAPSADIRRAVVSVGTHDLYPFHRLITQARQHLSPDTEVVWQTGSTDVSLLGLRGRPSIPSREFESALRSADVVVAHAGAGTALAALEAGKCPILVPRRKSAGEHVDDHQVQLAEELARRGLAVNVVARKLTHEDLLLAAATRVVRVDQPTAFTLAA